jgi:exopolyphosphatase/pppGpp-phosphohydrolase
MKYSKLIKKLDEQEKSDLKFVLKLAKSCNFEERHSKHVTIFALKIFDGLQELHHLGRSEKYLLLCAGILHDIGVHTEGPKNHHKAALNIILNTPILQCDNKTRLMIGSIARYHRGSLPSLKHDHFKSLTANEREVVTVLSSFLRVADGLDYSHKNRIRDVRAGFTKKIIEFDCQAKKLPVKLEISSAIEKGDLLERCFKRGLKFKIFSIEEFSGWN